MDLLAVELGRAELALLAAVAARRARFALASAPTVVQVSELEVPMGVEVETAEVRSGIEQVSENEQAGVVSLLGETLCFAEKDASSDARHTSLDPHSPRRDRREEHECETKKHEGQQRQGWNPQPTARTRKKKKKGKKRKICWYRGPQWRLRMKKKTREQQIEPMMGSSDLWRLKMMLAWLVAQRALPEETSAKAWMTERRHLR